MRCAFFNCVMKISLNEFDLKSGLSLSLSCVDFLDCTVLLKMSMNNWATNILVDTQKKVSDSDNFWETGIIF